MNGLPTDWLGDMLSKYSERTKSRCLKAGLVHNLDGRHVQNPEAFLCYEMD